jgi:hypothetical protein
MNTIIAASGAFSLTSDGLQWIASRRGNPIGFVRSRTDILCRVLREDGASPEDVRTLTGALPPTFDAWLEQNRLHVAPIAEPEAVS